MSSVLIAQDEIPRDSTIQDPTIQTTAQQDTIAQDLAIQDTILQEPVIQDTSAVDTSAVVASTVVASSVEEPQKEKKESKRKDSFKIYGGGTVNGLNVTDDLYESSQQGGYMLGLSYKRGKFFYYEFGARYNHYGYLLRELSDPGNGRSYFSVGVLDIPLNLGLNLTSFVDRIVGVRIFAGVVPAFRLSVGDNDLGISKENTNSFNFQGQAGLGVDILFLFIEAGFNYGFSDLLMNDIQSNPAQVFINLGFRF